MYSLLIRIFLRSPKKYGFTEIRTDFTKSYSNAQACQTRANIGQLNLTDHHCTSCINTHSYKTLHWFAELSMQVWLSLN